MNGKSVLVLSLSLSRFVVAFRRRRSQSVSQRELFSIEAFRLETANIILLQHVALRFVSLRNEAEPSRAKPSYIEIILKVSTNDVLDLHASGLVKYLPTYRLTDRCRDAATPPKSRMPASTSLAFDAADDSKHNC